MTDSHHVFTKTEEVTLWYLLKTVAGVGAIQLAIAIVGYVSGGPAEIALGIATASVMLLLGSFFALAVALLFPEAVFDD